MRAISRLVRDAGTTTSACRARDALRIRVSKSAMGWEVFVDSLPARLRDGRERTEERPLPEADPAQREPPHEAPGSTADRAAVIALDGVLRCALCLGDQRFLGHVTPPRALAGEGHAEEFEQTLRLLVRLRRRHDADLQPA